MDIEFYKVKEHVNYLFIRREDYKLLVEDKDFEKILRTEKFEKRTLKEIKKQLETREYIIFKDTEEFTVPKIATMLEERGMTFILTEEEK